MHSTCGGLDDAMKLNKANSARPRTKRRARIKYLRRNDRRAAIEMLAGSDGNIGDRPTRKSTSVSLITIGLVYTTIAIS